MKLKSIIEMIREKDSDLEIEDELIQNEKTLLSVLTPYVIAIVLSSFMSFLIMSKFHPVIVEGNSMSPTYHNGDILTCETDFTVDSIKRGDIVIFTKNRKTYIKRVIGLPGENIFIFNGNIYINNVILKDYNFGHINFGGVATLPLEIEKDHFFCIGDNRNSSNDSRDIGTVAFDEIEYVVSDVLFSFSEGTQNNKAE